MSRVAVSCRNKRRRLCVPLVAHTLIVWTNVCGHDLKLNLLYVGFILFSASCGSPAPVRTSTNPELTVTGQEVWTIDGNRYDIDSTAILLLSNGKSLYLVKSLCDFAPKATHKPHARLLAQYAVDNGYLSKADTVQWNHRPIQLPGAVGVALIQQQSVGTTAMNAGYRYNFLVDDLTQSEWQPTQHLPQRPCGHAFVVHSA